MKATCALLLSLSAEQSQTVRAFSPRGKNQVLLPSSVTHPQFMNEAFSGKRHFASEQFQEVINHLSNRTERQRAVSASPEHQQQHPNTHALTLLQPLAFVLAQQQQNLHWSIFTCQIPP